jgi:hypothetical protein
MAYSCCYFGYLRGTRRQEVYQKEEGQMEILKKLLEQQNSLEDALRLESTPGEVKETKEGKKLLRYLRWRRRKVSRIIRVLRKIKGE